MADVGVQPVPVQEPQAAAGQQRIFYGWWLVGVTLITQGVGAGIIDFAYSGIVVPLEREFHSTRLQMMLAITCCLVISNLLTPWLGPKADRGSMRALMAAGVSCLALGFGVMSFATAVWQVILCYAAFMSFAVALLGPLTASTLIARWFTTRRGTALGIGAIGAPLGGFLFPPLM
jgi:MFS family permease